MQATKDKLLMRDSNLELLRFIAALMVVVYHCDFLSFASEDTDVTLFSDWQIYSYALVKTFTCCCVNTVDPDLQPGRNYECNPFFLWN